MKLMSSLRKEETVVQIMDPTVKNAVRVVKGAVCLFCGDYVDGVDAVRMTDLCV